MTDLRNVVLGMEQVVNDTAELAAALHLCALWADENGLNDADRAGVRCLARLVAERSSLALGRWRALDRATGPAGGAR